MPNPVIEGRDLFVIFWAPPVHVVHVEAGSGSRTGPGCSGLGHSPSVLALLGLAPSGRHHFASLAREGGNLNEHVFISLPVLRAFESGWSSRLEDRQSRRPTDSRDI